GGCRLFAAHILHQPPSPLFFYHYPRAHRDLHSFPTRRSSDLDRLAACPGLAARRRPIPAQSAGHPADPRMGHTRMQDLCSEAERSEEHTSELQSRFDLVCRLLLEKKKK